MGYGRNAQLPNRGLIPYSAGDDLFCGRQPLQRDPGSAAAVRRELEDVAAEVVGGRHLQRLTRRHRQPVVGVNGCSGKARGDARQIDGIAEAEARDRVGRQTCAVDLEGAGNAWRERDGAAARRAGGDQDRGGGSRQQFQRGTVDRSAAAISIDIAQLHGAAALQLERDRVGAIAGERAVLVGGNVLPSLIEGRLRRRS